MRTVIKVQRIVRIRSRCNISRNEWAWHDLWTSTEDICFKLGFEGWLDIFYLVKSRKDVTDSVRRYCSDDRSNGVRSKSMDRFGINDIPRSLNIIYLSMGRSRHTSLFFPASMFMEDIKNEFKNFPRMSGISLEYWPLTLQEAVISSHYGSMDKIKSISSLKQRMAWAYLF